MSLLKKLAEILDSPSDDPAVAKTQDESPVSLPAPEEDARPRGMATVVDDDPEPFDLPIRPLP